MTVMERVNRAISVMEYQGIGMYTAARRSGTTARTIKKYLKREGLGFKIRKGRYKVIKALKLRVEDAMCDMSTGVSASEAARNHGTTLASLKKMQYRGRPVLRKVGGKWKSNYICIYDWSVVFFGRVRNMEGNNMGNPQPLQEAPDDKYATILWQYDCNTFKTPLDPVKLCEFHPQRVLDMLRAKLVNTVRANPTAADAILNQPTHGAKAAAQATLDLGLKRIPSNEELREIMQLSYLDAYFKKYKLDFDDEISCGVDDNLTPRRPKFVAVSYFQRKAQLVMKTKGKFEIIVRRGADAYHYPPTPASISYSHDWKDEAVLNKISL